MNHPTPSRPPFTARLAALGLLAALAGCNIVPPAQEDSTRYFVLSDSGVPVAQAPAQGGLRIGLKSVRLEGYLKNRSMVVRTGVNEIRFQDFRRWAEPLDTAISRTLRARLLASPSVAQVIAEPFPFDQARDYDVSIEVGHFEGIITAKGTGAENMAAVVEISTPGPNSRVVSRKLFTSPASEWNGTDYDQLAAMLSADISGLASEILADIPAKP